MTTTPQGQATVREPLGAVLTAVLANRFEVIVREMTNTLFRAGRSAVLNMARDFSCCIVTADNQLLAAAEGLQAHVLGAGLQTSWMQKLHPDLAPGDAFIHNDPLMGNTHPADHTLLVPVFIDGKHVFTASAKAHQADCGNSQPTTYMSFARDVYEEGALMFPCVRIQRGYEDVDDIVRMCRARIRVPEMWYGDYLAAIGAVRIGERRLQELADRYGLDVLERFVGEWLDYSERRMTEAIKALPTRTMHVRGRHDPVEGFPDGITVDAGVTINGDDGRIEVDLRDNGDCLPLGLNLSESCARSGALIAIFNCLPEDVPHNAGSFRRVDVLIRPGSYVGGLEHPHSASVSTTNILNRLINAVQAGFAEIPGHGLAEGAGACGAGYSVVSGTDPASGEPYVNQLIIGNNGGPGTPVCDGWITYAMPDCAKTIYIDSIEILERKYPLRFRSLRLLADSGGAGRFRGAPASEVIFGPARGTMQAFYFADFGQTPPAGVLGGKPGSLATVSKIDRDGRETGVPTIGDVTLDTGEWVRGLESGGGGYGDPLERDPAAVLVDVLDGWVSRDAAESEYGVVLTGSADGELRLDLTATQALRARLRGG
ncbi:MAG TPA: hydantoinase B/oxoprolinase family protein [Candidatus Dormibacteraeota bacterium]|nr:hydantoinase B/oxoprolinase family protein [Candidatus Dormibacteraeota bacterium]